MSGHVRECRVPDNFDIASFGGGWRREKGCFLVSILLFDDSDSDVRCLVILHLKQDTPRGKGWIRNESLLRFCVYY